MSTAGLGGGAAAYKQLQRLPNEVGSVMSGIASRQQADKNANLARNERAKVAKDKKDDDFYNSVDINPDDFVVEATNWADADEIFGSVSQEAMDLSIDLNTKARKAWDMGNEEEARGYSDEAKRIQGSFKNFASKREQVATKMSEWEKLISEGKVLDGAQGQFYDALNRNEYKLDYSNGDFVITALMRDKNGEIIYEDGKAKYEQTSMNDLIKGNNDPYQFEDAMGKGGMIDGLMVNFGKSKIDELSKDGSFIVTDQSWSDENEIGLQNYIDGITGGDSGTPNNREMYKWYKNSTGKGKITKNAKDWTKEEKDAVAKYIREGVASKFENEVSMKVRGKTVEEANAEADKNRASREKMAQDGIASREGIAAANRKAQEDRLKMSLDAKAKTAKGKAKVAAMGKNPEDKIKTVELYDIAKDLHSKFLEAKASGGDFTEEDAKAYYNSLDTPFTTKGDLDVLGFFGNQYGMSGIKTTGDITADNIFQNVKAMARASGIEIKDTDIKEVLSDPDKYRLEDVTEEVEAKPDTNNDPLGLGI